LSIVFIVNPRSANGATLRKFDRVREQFVARLKSIDDVDVKLTQHPRHATELARAAVKAGAKAVISVGGDGTNNEVINGFFEENGEPIQTNTAFGVVTSGTGGDFRRTFRWSDDPLEALERIAKFQTKKIDVGRVRYTKPEGGQGTYVFVNSSGFGLSGAVVDIVNKSSKALGAKLSFMIGSLKGLVGYVPQRVKISVDGAPAEEAENLIAAVSNGQYFGGGMQIAPDARPDDGLFDYVAVTGRGVGLMARHGLKLYSGTHTRLPIVTVKKCKQVKAEPVRPDEKVLVELDGEQPGVLPATWEIVPQAVSLLV
jgi:YegS/Rv2252/BmrU family lipid kinase